MELFAVNVPGEVRLLSKALNKIDAESYKDIFRVVVDSMTGTMHKQSYERIFSGISDTQKKTFIAVVAGLLCLFKAIFRVPEHQRKPETLKTELEELKFSAGVIVDILDATFKQSIQVPLPFTGPHLPTLKQFNWRVDVSISTNALNRVLEPTIMVEMMLSNGSIKTFEMPMKKFHLLRCSVATVLKEIENLEKRNVIKMIEQ